MRVVPLNGISASVLVLVSEWSVSVIVATEVIVSQAAADCMANAASRERCTDGRIMSSLAVKMRLTKKSLASPVLVLSRQSGDYVDLLAEVMPSFLHNLHLCILQQTE